MNELIKITEQNGKKAVNARDLHTFLESKQDFSTWIKARIDKYDFIENQDFEVLHNFVENSNGGRPLKEYALSIDMAKELSMVEGNEKGKQARKYFIETEKAFRQVLFQCPAIPQTFSEALRLAASQQEQIEEQQNQIVCMNTEIIEMKKKTDYLEIILLSKGTVTTTQIAQDYGMSAKSFNKLLSDLKIQYKVNGQWILYAPYISKGYVHSKTVNIKHKNGVPDTVLNTEWRQSGRIFLYEKLKSAALLPLIER